MFGFFHPSLPGEPLVILHTAITRAIADNMPDILNDTWQEERPQGRVLMLYSISATQVGGCCSALRCRRRWVAMGACGWLWALWALPGRVEDTGRHRVDRQAAGWRLPQGPSC